MKKSEYWKKVVMLLFFGWMSIWIYRTMLTPVYEEMQVTLGNQSSLKMGMISSIYFFGYTFTQIPSGMLMDRIGRKKVMIPGFLLFLAGIVTIAFSNTLSTVYIGSLLAGIGTGTYYSGAFALTGEYIPDEKKYFATAFVNNGCAVGMMMGYLGSGYFVKQCGVNWKAIVVITGCLVCCITAAFCKILKDHSPQKGKKEKKEQKLSYRVFFKPTKIAAYLFYFATCYGYYMIATWLPSFLQTERGMQGSLASVYTSVIAAVSIPGALILGKLLDRFHKKSILVMTILQIGSACMLFFVTRCSITSSLILCLSIYGLCGKQAIDPMIVPHISKDIPDRYRGTALGIFNFFGMSGSILAPSITGYVEDLYGSKIYGFYIACILLTIASILFALTNRSSKVVNIGKEAEYDKNNHSEEQLYGFR